MTLTALSVLCGLLAVLLGFAAIRRMRRGRMLAAGSRGLVALLMLAIAALLGALSLNMHTYARLTHEAPVAELSFVWIEPGRYLASLTLPDAEIVEQYELRGEEWQIDARILKWRGLANLLGLDAQFRLERLSGRYRDLGEELNAERTVYDLSDNPGVDIWSMVDRYGQWLPWTDAVYGSATYLPMTDDAVYRVSITQSGLIARPANEAAREAVSEW